MNESNALLAEYVKNGSDTAFREIVRRYVDLVYSTALRQVGGDPHMAEDVAQSVFLHLARKAHRLSNQVMLGGWLHQDACHVAATLLRGERRRRMREKQAVEMSTLQDDESAGLAKLRPVLDTAINQLGPEDRRAILLRFFEQRDLRSVGEHLGRSEDAARMRVNRALEKLQLLLKRHGVTLSAAALGTALTGEALVAAPAGLGTAIASSALAGASTAGGIAAMMRLLAIGKMKFGVITGLVFACAVTPLVLKRQAQTRLQNENRSLQQQLVRLSSLSADNERLSNLLAEANGSLVASKAQVSDLLRLRAEVAHLREATNELEQLRRERLQWAAKTPSKAGAELTQQPGTPQFIYVGGEVNLPNRYLWTNGMTLQTLLTSAHGLTEQADTHLIQVTRDEGQSRTVTTFSFAQPNAYPEFTLQAGDKIFIPRAVADSTPETEAAASGER